MVGLWSPKGGERAAPQVLMVCCIGLVVSLLNSVVLPGLLDCTTFAQEILLAGSGCDEGVSGAGCIVCSGFFGCGLR